VAVRSILREPRNPNSPQARRPSGSDQDGTQLQTEVAPLPKKKRGPKPTVMETAAQRMVADIRGGEVTLCDLKTMKQESLAQEYGVKSRDTARKALARAAEIVAISNPDK